MTHESIGPWITLTEAAAWAGRDEDDMQRLTDLGIFSVLRASGRVLLSEREVGSYCGLEPPGPRETELLSAKWARELAAAPKLPRAVADHWLYWLYDTNETLLYVGITNSGVKRMEQHGAQKEWWPKVATIRVDHFATRAEAEKAERTAIREYLPLYNEAHRPRVEARDA